MTRDADDPELAAWGVLFATAIVFAIGSAPRFFLAFVGGELTPRTISSVVLVVVALAAVWRPASRSVLALLAAAMLAHVAILLPDAPNHRLILALESLALLLAIASARRAETLSALVPATRALVVIVYAFAFFAKLNGDFTDPATSCAAQFYEHVVAWWRFAPSGPRFAGAVIAATLGAEAALVIGLCLPRTRRLAVLLGLVFHFGLALDLSKHFVNFSAVMTALLVLFLGPGFRARLAQALDRPRTRARLALGLSGFLLAGFITTADWDRLAAVYFWSRELAWMLYSVTIIVFVWRSDVEDEVDAASYRRGWIAIVIAALALANGLGPYLGWKTRTAFDMYSNLRIEADRSNHWIVPRSLDIFGLLGDRVRILATDDATLRHDYLERGADITAFELARYLADHRATVEYRRGGKTTSVDRSRAESAPAPPPWWMRKLVVFRPIGESTRAICLW